MRNGGESVGAPILIEICVGAIFFGPSIAMALILAKYGAESPYFEWLLGASVSMGLMGVATLILLISAQATGRSFLTVTSMLAATLVNLGLCLVVGGLVFFYSSQRVDSDYMFFWVDMVDLKNIAAQLPVYIASRSPGSFEQLRVWWAPWGSEKNIYPETPDNPYWSIGFQMKSPVDLIRGGAKYGRSIHAGDYIIQYDATLRNVNYHFDEHLVIENENGTLVQKIDVWRMVIPGGERTLVYCGNSSKGPIQ